MTARAFAALAAALALACGPPVRVAPVEVGPLAPRAVTAQDTIPKEEMRLLPAEAYMRTYLMLFGGLAPMDVQARARGGDGNQLFDTWDDYLAALGFPDYRADLPRSTQTNALMLATFERLGVALCDRAVEHDLSGKELRGGPSKGKLVFTFDAPRALGREGFDARFDVLHRRFLGYPAALAPTSRSARFFALYEATAKRHAAGPRTRFTPEESGWAAVCYGLVRHPEFHLY